MNRPSHGVQGNRVAPMLDRLQQAVDARRMEVQQTLTGIDPDQVLVIETIGSVEEFANAVRRIPGLEWMGEFEVDEIEPSEGFQFQNSPDKPLSGRLYLILTDEAALRNLLTLWRSYKDDENAEFPRGLAKFRHAFDKLKDVRRWDAQDRLRDTGILEAWQNQLTDGASTPIRFEVELWFRQSDQSRVASADFLKGVITNAQGHVISECLIPEIAYHGLLAELPRTAVQEIVDASPNDIVKCESVMYFRPVGQVSPGDGDVEGEVEAVTHPNSPLPVRAPLLAILDGMPLENHARLEGRLIVDDPDGWADDYPAQDRVHGTGMASLAIHGDLSSGENPLASQVYIRPILKPSPLAFTIPRREMVPEGLLLIDLIHRAVRRLFESDGAEPPAAPTVRIINLSVGDPSNQFSQVMSAWGRLLDWLSFKYRILFIVSAGNHPGAIQIDLDESSFDSLSDADRRAAVLKAVQNESRLRRILSPSEAMNVLSVGALHHDINQLPPPGVMVDPLGMKLPSPVSSFGFGYRKSIKPEILFQGGRQMYRKRAGASLRPPTTILPSQSIAQPGCCVAYPDRAGGRDNIAFTTGTSNSAALISRNAVKGLEAISEILRDGAPGVEEDVFGTPLLKALLVHGCSWGQMESEISNVFPGLDWRGRIALLRRWLGYGEQNFEKALACTSERATVLGFGKLRDEEAHVFKLPLPPGLGNQAQWRRVTVSLAWLSPMRPQSQKYRCASLWFEASTQLNVDRIAGDFMAVRRGTIQHEIFEGDQVVPIVDGDSLSIKVNCRSDAGAFDEPIAYGLVVSLEVAEGVSIPVYDQVRERIAVRVPVQSAASVGV